MNTRSSLLAGAQLVLALAALLTVGVPAAAQQTLPIQANQEDVAQSAAQRDAEQFARWSQVLDDIENELSRERLTLAALGALRDEVAAVRDGAAARVSEITPNLTEQRALLETLLPADAQADLVETPEVVALRERINTLETQVQPAELLVARATALRERILARRSAEFAARLFERSSSLLTPQLWIDGLSETPRLAQNLGDLTRTSWASVRARASSASFAGLGVLVIVVVLLVLPFRRLAMRKAARRGGAEPSSFDKTLGALRIVLVSTLVPAVGFFLLLFALDIVGGMSLRADAILASIARNTILFFFISGTIRAFLAPGLPAWRLVPVDDGRAGNAGFFFRLAAFAYLLGETARTVAAVFISPLGTVQLLEAVPSLIAAVCILAGLRLIFRGLRAPESASTPPITHLLWRWILPVAGIAALAVLGAQLFGYLALAAFIVDRLIWTSLVLATLHLAATLVEGLTNATFQENGKTSTWLNDNVGLSRNGLGQFGVLLSGITKLVLILAAASFIIAPFGVETGQFTDVFRRVFTGIQFGGFTFSLTSVLVALALVVLGIVITRGIQGWLENRYLPRTSLDTGLKASIRTAIGYIGVIAAAAVGLSYLGLNLENIALVAGALSVGIGFGLQSIVSNFVSGLILLAERPFKQGDWIVVGEEQGIVKRINVRATELQTFDRATVLIPNSDFIAGTVKNRVHRDTLGRIDVPVGVGYDSDPVRVKEILLEIANAHPMTLSYPEPAAFFIEFGANSLDFMLFAYLADVGTGYGVRSDIRFEIFRRFKEEGIEIPFAQSDVTIRNLDQVLDVLAKAGLAAPEGLGAGGLSPDAGQRQAGVSTVPAPPDRAPTVSSPAERSASKRIDPDGDGDRSSQAVPDDEPEGRS